MARPKTNYHPLHTVRKAAGLTQDKLGQFLGVDAGTVQKIENGKLSMSRSIATKAHHQLGCHILLQADGKWSVCDKLLREDDSWTPYTFQDYEDHRTALRRFRTGNANDWSTGLVVATRLLVQAAIRKGVLPAIAFELEQALSRIFEDYRLVDGLAGHLYDEFKPILLQQERLEKEGLEEENREKEKSESSAPIGASPEPSMETAKKEASGFKLTPAMTGLKFAEPKDRVGHITRSVNPPAREANSAQ